MDADHPICGVLIPCLITALKSGVPTKTHVLNLLHRLVDGKTFTPPTLDAPQALTLTNEPKANVERYDTLRKTEVRHAS